MLALRGLAEIGAVLADPRLDVVAVPDLAHGEHAERLREIGPGHQLLHTLAADAEPFTDLGGAHEVSHDREHSHETSGHLTSRAMVCKGSHVTRDQEEGSRMTTLALSSSPASQRRCALYRHFDDQDVLLYVGITDTLADRTNSGHARTSDWVQYAVRAEAEWHDSRDQASTEERDAVETEHPIFNRQYAVGDVDRRIADYLHGREVRRLNGAIAFYENTVRQFLGTVPEQILKEIEGAALAMYQASGVSDERVFPAFLLNDLNFASRRRVASIRDDAALVAYQAVLDFIGKQSAAIRDPWAAAEEPPF